jgi:hypothetical protein
VDGRTRLRAPRLLTMDQTPSLTEEAFFDPLCRPTWRWASCGPNFQNSLAIFYWFFFGLHTVSTLIALTYTAMKFCFSSEEGRTRGQMSLRVFTSISIMAQSCASVPALVACFDIIYYAIALADLPIRGVLQNVVPTQNVSCSRLLCLLKWSK